MREVDTRTVYRSLFAATRFFYENGPRLVVVSVLWFVCSLPVVTVGPATLAAYAAIASLRDPEVHTLDRAHVAATLRRHGVSAALLSGVPLAFAVVAALYVERYLAARSTVALVLGVVTAYAALYAALLLVPTFAGLATGDDVAPALRTAVRWTGRNALAAVMMGMGTVLLFVVTGLLTVAFVVVFAGVTFSFHLETLLDPPEEAPDDAWTPYERARG
jgi:hypothetical protein